MHCNQHRCHRRYGLRDQSVPRADAGLQATLQDIDSTELDAEARADKLADVALLRPSGLALCYSRRTTLQEVVPANGGTQCEAQGLMTHYPHAPYSGGRR